MANHKSAEKRARANARRSSQNSKTLGAVRSFEKKVRVTLATGDKSAAQTALKEYMSKAMAAATGGVIHAKTAARKISRLAKQASKAK